MKKLVGAFAGVALALVLLSSPAEAHCWWGGYRWHCTHHYRPHYWHSWYWSHPYRYYGWWHPYRYYSGYYPPYYYPYHARYVYRIF